MKPTFMTVLHVALRLPRRHETRSCRRSACCPKRMLWCPLARHPSPFALRYRRACSAGNSSVFSVPLCPLCQTQPSSSTRRCHAGRAWEVFFEHRGHRGTENTEKLQYVWSGLSRPFDTSGWRRHLRSPAHARGQPPWVSQRCLVKTRVPPRRHRHREWGLRPQAPPPPCGQHRAPLRKGTAMVPGWAVWACGRRTHSRSRHGPGASEVLTRRCWSSHGVCARAWAGERMPGPHALAQT
jgi:hypothetical protein